MTESTHLLPAELIEIGLAAAADPAFAERLIEALARQPGAACARAPVGETLAMLAP